MAALLASRGLPLLLRAASLRAPRRGASARAATLAATIAALPRSAGPLRSCALALASAAAAALSSSSPPSSCASAPVPTTTSSSTTTTTTSSSSSSSSSPPPLRVLCLHGVTSDMYGRRGVLYGPTTLAQIDAALAALAARLGVAVECYATNEEGAMADRIHAALTDGTAAVLINPGAWTHYSYGIRDALAILHCPIIEVHMSNMHAREDMRGSMGEEIRHHSVVSPIAKGIICGFGVTSYELGLYAAVAAAQQQ
ncbi:hypothetical protein AB1Y20_011581 [Prymnesium parvum]|uniref:3-dehydroquinate dehydratase n=1 Tax=Prymnesium parvum TaxID=97485 RepID=A0AB34IHJ8_PRYPA